MRTSRYIGPVISGEQLRERRRLAGYRSQPALAEALDVSPRTIWEWETNGVPLDQEMKVRRLLWPSPPNIRDFDDWELLIELGRRLALRTDNGLDSSRETGATPTDGQGRKSEPQHPPYLGEDEIEIN